MIAGCGSAGSTDASAQVVDLPGAAAPVNFDDVVYSQQLQRIVVPARRSGVYLVDPESGDARHVGYSGDADSVDTSGDTLYVLDRRNRQIHVVDPENGHVLSSVPTSAPPDYIRFVAATHEVWVSEPGAARIEIFAVGSEAGGAPSPSGFVAVPEGPEGLTLTTDAKQAYAHAGRDVVAIDTQARGVTARWATGCAATHGFPRIDERDGLLLASCADDGKVTLLNVSSGRRLGEYDVGGGESLPAYSPSTGHFYVRSDPGTRIATLQASQNGLQLVRQVEVPKAGHCLGAGGGSHYWTCDADTGSLLLFTDG
jgi:hypothetical protein